MGYAKDKNITKTLPGFRRILAHITPNRQAAQVFFQHTIDLSKTIPWIEAYNIKTGRSINLLKLFMTFVGKMLHAFDFLFVKNYIVAGGSARSIGKSKFSSGPPSGE